MGLIDDGGGSLTPDTAGPITTPQGGGFWDVLRTGAMALVPAAVPYVEGARAFFGGTFSGASTGLPGITVPLEGGGTSTTYGDVFGGGGGGGGGGWRASTASSVRSVIPRFLEGAAVAAALYETYRALRARGMGHTAAKKLAHRMHGVFSKRRRMKTTNPRALRRAMRRIRGARKMFSKVRGLMGVHHYSMGGGWHRGRGRGRSRRGDLYEDVENEQDTIDDLLDDGYTPEEIQDFFGGIG